MNRVQDQWTFPPGAVECCCPGEYANDFSVVGSHYANNFIPDGRYLLYGSLSEEESGRIYYLTGKCLRCGGQMRSGSSVAANITGDRLLSYIYREYERFTPHALYQHGSFATFLPERGAWYLEQKQLREDVKEEQFVAMFHAEDQNTVRTWWRERRVPIDVRCCGNCRHSHGALPFASPNMENGCDVPELRGPLYTAAMRLEDWQLGHCCRFWAEKE